LMSAGGGGAPAGRIDIAISGCTGSSGDGFSGAVLAQAVAAELDGQN
jgi:hypothetical protein